MDTQPYPNRHSNAKNSVNHGLLYVPATSTDATHVLVHSLTHRGFLLPTKSVDVNEQMSFFGLSSSHRLASRALHLIQPKHHVRLLDLGDDWLNTEANHNVILVGTIGPHQKFTMRASYPNHSGHAVVKFSTRNTSNRLVLNEADTLKALLGLKPLSKYVPRLIAHDITSMNAGWIAQSISTGQSVSARDEKAIISFLELLTNCTRHLAPFPNSSARARLKRVFADLHDNLSPEWQLRAKQVMQFLDHTAPSVVSWARAHGDFTAWNIKTTAGVPFVFDWEYSIDQQPIGYDYLHFHILPLVAKGRLNLSIIREISQKAPEWVWSKSTATAYWVLAFYLLDISAIYLKSNNGDDSRDMVVQTYSSLLDNMLIANPT